ncbi:hypothetical protein LWI29_021108 [Acer saccharum]|uniref:Uncharacterized protein n=1 Tax=Acer saccharum TaxID=4024 RepID=A0AA39T4N7_ACESA|nr:hypothetical protein LWI29_021108 [Acer saccharum]
MKVESFEDEGVAKWLKDLFVSIKVDKLVGFERDPDEKNRRDLWCRRSLRRDKLVSLRRGVAGVFAILFPVVVVVVARPKPEQRKRSRNRNKKGSMVNAEGKKRIQFGEEREKEFGGGDGNGGGGRIWVFELWWIRLGFETLSAEDECRR